MEDILYRRIPEVSYLDSENTWRYRAILHFFFRQHERLRHFLFPEEIFAHLKQLSPFTGYTEEQLQQDLNALVAKKNLIERQDASRVTSINDFKNKKYRYQCTPYTIEIERLILRLKEIGDTFGGSLEITLFDNLLEKLILLTDPETSLKMEDQKINQLWEDMYGYFKKMVDNATDYLAHLKSEKVEEHMKTEAFLTYKDAFTDYLRNFIIGLQQAAYRIEARLTDINKELIENITGRLAKYQLTIPRLTGTPPDFDQLQEQYRLSWNALKEWFLGFDGQRSEWRALQNETIETIRRITRFAQHLGERLSHSHSRRKDYMHLATWFTRIDDITQAHKLSSVIFGVEQPRHLQAPMLETDDMDIDFWQIPSHQVKVTPRIRNYRERQITGAVLSRKEEKEEKLREHLLQRETELRLIEQIIGKEGIILADLPEISPYIRKTILNWISKSQLSVSRQVHVETGDRLYIVQKEGKRVSLRCEDGGLDMPDFEIKVL